MSGILESMQAQIDSLRAEVDAIKSAGEPKHPAKMTIPAVALRLGCSATFLRENIDRLPEPDAIIGSRPKWKLETIDAFQARGGFLAMGYSPRHRIERSAS